MSTPAMHAPRLLPISSLSRLSARALWILGLSGLLFSAVGPIHSPASAADELTQINFDRDIRPILSDTCYACHGPDDAKRKAGLRLDRRESAFAHRDDGAALVAGDPQESTLYQRITSDDPTVRMPPPTSGRQLTPRQIELVRRWISEGAKWEEHWAWIAPKRRPAPCVARPQWCRNAIDAIVFQSLERSGRTPAPPASKATLLRRATLDLTGLPPSLSEIEAFEHDSSPNAYERVVERLLASPRHGERMAIRWLEAARYADTNGYQTDGERSMWRWRDWVIDAFNANMPFDQFTIEQLAGDLLPNATLDQRIASGFNRNHRGNGEGGIIPEEYLAEYAVDRVETTATVWMGITLGCARCHDHKYDPFRQKEFYQFFAFFDNVPERGRAIKVGNSPPVIKAPTADDQRTLAGLERSLVKARQQFDRQAQELAKAQQRWESSSDPRLPADWGPGRDLVAHWSFEGGVSPVNPMLPRSNCEVGTVGFVSAPVGRAAHFDGRTFVNAGNIANFGYFDAFTLSAWIRPKSPDAGTIVSRMQDSDDGAGYSIGLLHGKVQVNLVARWLDDAIRLEAANPIADDRWHHVAVSYDGTRVAKGVRIVIDGRSQRLHVHLDELNQSFASREPLRIGGGAGPRGRFRGDIDEVRIYDRALSAEEVSILSTPDRLPMIREMAAERRSPGQAAKLRWFFIENRAPAQPRETLERVRALEDKIERLTDSFPTVMVMAERNPPIATHVLVRGQYDRPGELVSRGVPAILSPASNRQPQDRLALARWLVSSANPLTARVIVNRQWQMFFGDGLVRTGEDFGSQGDRPSQPALLDWLATEFVRLGWDLKALDRLIVTSATYRQSSDAQIELIDQDPENRLLARGPRKRLSAEMIRDQALAASGLLVERLGGPSVRPYQPPGLWKDLNGGEYKMGKGPDLYRRSLYTYWKRTVAPPAMVAFDAATRETCTVRETRTNTPLQALNLLNDVTYLQCSRKLAERVMELSATPAAQLAIAFRLVLTRKPRADEVRILERGYQRSLAEFRAQPSAASKLLDIETSAADTRKNSAELAACTTTVSVILNLSETVTKK